ncbi:hypothetical protein HPP92_019613 [Vanilla planifolia]|uniref:Uncharacterized protein n=1 Tax=Vanilla planifolia TaxID=51239 RepID=A0A835Q9B4_VANPL|nr:hypothetical protein HPP92_019613 [Vanilla planifolia]
MTTMARICHQCVSGAIKQQNVDIDFKIDKTAIVHVGLGKGLRTEETTREERRGEKKRRRANSGCLRRGLEMASLPLGPHNPQEHEMTQRLTLVGRRQRRRKEWPVAGHIISTTIGGKNGEAKQTVSYIAERVVGDWIFGIVFQVPLSFLKHYSNASQRYPLIYVKLYMYQVDPTHKLSFVIFSGAKVLLVNDLEKVK